MDPRADDGMEAGPTEIGAVVAGKYLLGRQIGEGSMARVFEATNQWTQGKAAVKWLRVRAEADPTTAQRFIREARTAARLAHPNIVMTLDMGQQEDGALYLVQELLHGKDLNRLIEDRGKLGPRQALAILQPIMRALAYAHERGVVHRDVKPANIFLLEVGPETVPKLVDFGMAKVLRDESSAPLTQSGAILGTPYYMAPEQILGSTGLDGRVDQWACAVTFYHVLTGDLPFRGASFVDLAKAIVQLDPEPLPWSSEVFERLWPVLCRALAKAAEDRFPDMRAFGDAVVEAIEPRPAAPPRTDSVEVEPTVVDERPAEFVVARNIERDAEIGGVLRVGLAGLGEHTDTQIITRAFERVMRVPCELSRAVDYRDLVRALHEGEVDLAWLPPVAYLEADRHGAVIPLVSPFRHGRKSYASALLGFSAKVRTLDEVPGSAAAWVDPWSAAGHLVPRAMLREAGIDPDRLLGSEHFLGAYPAVIDALRSGTAQVGGCFCSLDDAGDITWSPWPEDGTLTILRVSEAIPPDLMCARGTMEPGRARAIAAALRDGPRAYDVLQIVKASGFVEPDLEGFAAFARSVRDEMDSPPELDGDCQDV